MTLITDNVEELKKKLEYYEAIFSADSLHIKIRERLKTTPQLAAVIKALLLSNEELITREAIILVSEPYGRKVDHPDRYAKVVAWRVRTLLAKQGMSLTNQYNTGYLFKAEDREKLKEVLK